MHAINLHTLPPLQTGLGDDLKSIPFTSQVKSNCESEEGKKSNKDKTYCRSGFLLIMQLLS